MTRLIRSLYWVCLAVLWTMLLVAEARAAVATYTNLSLFQTDSGATADGTMPCCGTMASPVTIGSMDFSAHPPSSLNFNNWTSFTAGNELALNGVESFNINFVSPIYSLGFAWVDVTSPNSSSHFDVTFKNGGATVGTSDFGGPVNVALFRGFASTQPFDRVEFRESFDDGANEFFAQFYTSADEFFDPVINTTSGTITGDGDGDPNAVFGVPFTSSVSDEIRTFKIAGDLNVPADIVVNATGSNAASLLVANDVNLDAGASIDFSGIENTQGPGGGNGGAPSTNFISGGGGGALLPGTGALGGLGGTGGVTFLGGAAGLAGILGGSAGNKGGTGGENTNAGNPGTNGLNSPGTGGAAGHNDGPGEQLPGGAGGDGGAGGCNFFTLGVCSAGGAGGAGGSAGSNGSTGSAGDAADVGELGGTGTRGRDGTGGSNSGGSSHTVLSGGGGGGAASDGSGGGGGGSGGGGAGGGGGGGGGGGTTFFDFGGGVGGSGGGGGVGGVGGRGGGGGRGGQGGGGGGAFEIVANGKVNIAGSLLAQGANGETGDPGIVGQFGATANSGGNGLPGFNPDPDTAGTGGTGGHGGSGGRGGQGGTGGAGGNGGGGGGGTVKLVGSVTDTLSATVNSSGGTGAGDGRFIFGNNTTGGFDGTIQGAAATIAATGPRDANPFVSGTPSTPFIPGLTGGAEVFGLTGLDADIDLPDVVSAAPANAIAALVYLDLGPTGFADDYTGFDMLLAVNLDDEALTDLMFGAGAAGFKTGLLERGVANNPNFGGSGAVPLAELAAGAVYATLVPDNETDFQLSAMGFSQAAGTMADGEMLFLVAGLSGDYNGNGAIDAADYTIWRDAVTAGATSLTNDPTPGVVDESDFLYWRAHFGETLGSGAGSLASVPEPASLGLLLLGALFAVIYSTRRFEA